MWSGSTLIPEHLISFPDGVYDLALIDRLFSLHSKSLLASFTSSLLYELDVSLDIHAIQYSFSFQVMFDFFNLSIPIFITLLYLCLLVSVFALNRCLSLPHWKGAVKWALPFLRLLPDPGTRAVGSEITIFPHWDEPRYNLGAPFLQFTAVERP